MFSNMLNKAKEAKLAAEELVLVKTNELKNAATETIDNGVEKTKEVSTSAINNVAQKTDVMKESANNAIKSVDLIYEEKVKTFLTENSELVKEKAMENKLFSRLMVEGLTRSVAVPIIATIIYNILPSPIQFLVEEDSFVYFVENNLELLEALLDLENLITIAESVETLGSVAEIAGELL